MVNSLNYSLFFKKKLFYCFFILQRTERRTTGQGKNRRTMTYTRWDHETIFDFKLLFLEKDPNINELYIEPNEYNYPFKFILPAGNIPTSYQHYEAYIRYCLEAIIDIPWATNITARKSISIINPIDLNSIPGLRQPCAVSDTKVVCCGPCKSDPIIIEFNTNKSNLVLNT